MTIDDEWEELREKELSIIKSEELRERKAFMEFVANTPKKKKCSGAYCWCASDPD